MVEELFCLTLCLDPSMKLLVSTAEKMHIALGRRGFIQLPKGCNLLNKRSELMSKCRHQAKFTLKRVKEEEEDT